MKSKFISLWIVLLLVTMPLYYLLLKKITASDCDLIIGPASLNCYQNLSGVAGFAYNNAIIFYLMSFALYFIFWAIAYSLIRRAYK